MNLWPLRALVTSLTFQCAPGAVPVTVTRPGSAPITATGIWESSRDEDQPFGTDIRKVAGRRLMSLPVALVALVNRGDEVSAPLAQGLAAVTWKVDGFADPSTPEYHRVFLIRA